MVIAALYALTALLTGLHNVYMLMNGLERRRIVLAEVQVGGVLFSHVNLRTAIFLRLDYRLSLRPQPVCRRVPLAGRAASRGVLHRA